VTLVRVTKGGVNVISKRREKCATDIEGSRSAGPDAMKCALRFSLKRGYDLV